MEIFRVTRDLYGQETLQGVSWDLLWIGFGAGALYIIGHILHMLFWAPKVKLKAKQRAESAEGTIAGE